MDEGYGVDPQRLQATGEGLDQTIGELTSLGLGVAARTGNNVGNLALDGMRLRHAGLTRAVAEFCDRWSWGVRGLVQEGNRFARELGLAAGSYHESEQYAAGVFEEVLGALAGDATAPPDHSPESMAKAVDHIGQTWAAEGTDVVRTAVDRLDTPSRIAAALTGQEER